MCELTISVGGIGNAFGISVTTFETILASQGSPDLGAGVWRVNKLIDQIDRHFDLSPFETVDVILSLLDAQCQSI